MWHEHAKRVPSGDGSEAIDHVVDERLQVTPALVGSQAAALDTRRVEEIANQAVQPFGFLFDGLGEALPFLLGPLDVLLAQATG